MCIAIPAKIIAIDGLSAWVERYGECFQVNLMLLDEAVSSGDYVIVQARAYAVEKLSEAQAQEAYRLFDEFLRETTPLHEQL